MNDTSNIETTCAELLERMQRTAQMAPGPLRTDQMLLEHRESRLALEAQAQYIQGFSDVHKRLVRLVSRALKALSPVTNGRRFWIPKLPDEAKTALIVLNTFMRSNSK